MHSPDVDTMIETTIMLKPTKEWRPGVTKSQIIADLTERLTQVPGYVPGFLQPIENLRKRCACLESTLRGSLDHGSVSQRIRKGDAQLNHVSAAPVDLIDEDDSGDAKPLQCPHQHPCLGLHSFHG